MSLRMRSSDAYDNGEKNKTPHKGAFCLIHWRTKRYANANRLRSIGDFP